MKCRVDQRPLHINTVQESIQISKEILNTNHVPNVSNTLVNFLPKRKKKCTCLLMSWNPPKPHIRSIKIYSNNKQKKTNTKQQQQS